MPFDLFFSLSIIGTHIRLKGSTEAQSFISFYLSIHLSSLKTTSTTLPIIIVSSFSLFPEREFFSANQSIAIFGDVVVMAVTAADKFNCPLCV